MPLDFSSSIDRPSYPIPPNAGAVAPSGGEEGRLIGAARYDLSSRLMESFLHEARNPLNVLSINLDVLAQKLKATTTPSGPDKYLRAMREQIQRVDTIMRDFAEFLAPEARGAYDGRFSETLSRALRVAGHEFRRGKVRLTESVEPNLKVLGFSIDAVHFLALQPIIRGVLRSPPGTEVEVRARSDGGQVHFFVHDMGDDSSEPFPFAVPALEKICTGNDGSVLARGPETNISLPSA